MTMLSGQMVEVVALQRGTQATAAASVGDTVLYVDDVTDFDDAGGRLDITGTQYDYLTCDEPSATITLASPLTDAVDEDDPVLVLAGSMVAVDRYAMVNIDSYGADPVWVPLSYDQLWSVQAYDPPLPVLVSGDLSKVVDAPGATNIISADTVAGDPLADLINPNSKTTSGTLPGSAALGDICLIDSNAYVCTTAYASGGTLADNWTLATDPRTIALISLTSIAVFSADNANTNANAAIVSANGKTMDLHLASPPTSTTAAPVGSVAWVYTAGNVSSMYRCTAVSGTTYTWASLTLNDSVFSSIDVGKITGGRAAFLQGVINTLTSISITSSSFSTPPGGAHQVVINSDGTVQFYGSGGLGGTLYGTNDGSVNALALGGGSTGMIFGSEIIVNGSLTSLTVDGPFSQSNTAINGMRSSSIPNTPYGAGNLLRINMSNGIIAYDSSGLKHKIDVHRLADAAVGGPILALEPIRYRDRCEVEQRAAGDPDFQYEASWCIGWSAESFADAGWEELIIRTPEGEPDSLHYDRVLPALALEIRDRFEVIEADNADLRAQVASLAAQVAALTSGGTTNGA